MTPDHSCIRLFILAAAILGSSACSTAEPMLQETRELELSVASDATLIIDAGAGSLSLQGVPGAEVIAVTAEIWQVAPNDEYTLTLELDETGTAHLVSQTDTGLGANRDRVDLDIFVPASTALDITDGSGSMQISALTGPLRVEDGSGSLRIDDVGGDVTIDDDSGSLRVEKIAGELRITDGSGSITVRDAGGSVTIDDGSGSISVTDAAGVVTVDDGSGSIDVDGAQDFELLDDGSGSVNLRNIRSR